MSIQSSEWYIRGEDDQPTGPFTAEELVQSLQAGRLDANTICWREGMPQWLPIGEVEPFATALRRATQDTAARGASYPAGPPAMPASTPPARYRANMPMGRYFPAIAGCAAAGTVFLVVLLAAALLTRSPSESAGWPSAVRVHQGGTTYLVGLKDAWWTDYGSSSIRLFDDGGKQEKKTFVIVYYYKNIGPREGRFTFDTGGPFNRNKVELQSDKGHIFPGYELGQDRLPVLFGIGPKTRDVGGWRPKDTSTIEETGECALIFKVPEDEIPTELVTSGRVDLRVTLPQRTFGFRRHTEAFGFLPSPAEKAVPGLIDALQDKDDGIRSQALEVLGKMGDSAKEAVPAIEHVLLNDEYIGVREKAAETLGHIGPAAKSAIPALKGEVSGASVRYGAAYWRGLDETREEALKKISGEPPVTRSETGSERP